MPAGSRTVPGDGGGRGRSADGDLRAQARAAALARRVAAAARLRRGARSALQGPAAAVARRAAVDVLLRAALRRARLDGHAADVVHAGAAAGLARRAAAALDHAAAVRVGDGAAVGAELGARGWTGGAGLARVVRAAAVRGSVFGRVEGRVQAGVVTGRAGVARAATRVDAAVVTGHGAVGVVRVGVPDAVGLRAVREGRVAGAGFVSEVVGVATTASARGDSQAQEHKGDGGCGVAKHDVDTAAGFQKASRGDRGTIEASPSVASLPCAFCPRCPTR